MALFYLSIGLTVVSTVVYHIAQKSTPGGVHPILALGFTYALATLVCLALLLVYPVRKGVLVSLRELNWASYALAFAITGIEIGFLLAYRAGWSISLAAIASNVAVTMLLVPIGLLAFRERVSPLNVLGVAFCLLGLVFVNLR